jgi:hypothetical protein
MRKILAAAVLALSCACAPGYTEGSTGTTDGSIPLGTVTSDGGDAGADAGDAGADAGFDGGCVTTSRIGLAVIDGCTGGQPLPGTASLSVSAQTCAVSITTNTVLTPCNGVADGGSNSFTGACGGFNDCTSSSLPGTIFCNSGTCTLVICDGGTCP